MRILLLLSESWNDILHPNNNLTNWFLGFPDAEIWTISGSGEMPANVCCKDYFMVSEGGMLKSLLGGKKVGKAFHFQEHPQFEKKPDQDLKQAGKKYLPGELRRLARDLVWRFGRYDQKALGQFIAECSPDIVFSQRMGSIKMCRLEKLVAGFTSAPMVAYTGDDEYSLHQFSLSPLFWIRRLWLRSCLKQRIPEYKLFYSQSYRQMEEFQKDFRSKTKFLVKCGDFYEERIHRTVNAPIQLIYAGKLYCNRWKTLSMIAEAITAINKKHDCVKCQLNIYTADDITPAQNAQLNDGTHSVIHGAVPGSQLQEIYAQADIVLHVESFDIKNRLLTQDSFSTKVMDCLSSGCAVMAVCWEGHAAYQYLKKRDAALAASSCEEILTQLESVVDNPHILTEYAQKAYQCGSRYHQRETIQKEMNSDFKEVIDQC